MDIPKVWEKASGDGQLPDGRVLPVSTWGWGDDEAAARSTARERLGRLLERLRSGQPFPEGYGYGNRPLREEILETISGEQADNPVAMVTRNRYGAKVLNTARLLFLDIDIPPQGLLQRLRRLFGAPAAEEVRLEELRQALTRYGRATFRIYRTASGFRALAVDREYDPAGREAQELMQATGTDPAFSRLCRAQGSFRARLTPKPWRCDLSLPPGRYPREETNSQQAFAAWLRQYEKVSESFAVCRYLETVGSGSARGEIRTMLELHDRVTRCDSQLPLA